MDSGVKMQSNLPTFIPTSLLHASLPESLRRSTLWIDAEISSKSAGLPDVTGKEKGSSFKFSKAVKGIAKEGQVEESSYHGRGDGKFEDGSNLVKQ